MNLVKEWVLAEFSKGGNWRSVREASKKLAPGAKAIAEKEGARFTTDDVPARIYQWLLYSKKV